MPVTLINPFTVAAEAEPGFVESWKRTAAVFAGRPGYLDTRLYQSIDPQAHFRFINVAHWDSAEAWSEAMKVFPLTEGGVPGIEAKPALYTQVAGGDVPARNPATEDAIRGMEAELARAYQANDAAALAGLLADDYGVTDGPGTVSDKAKVLADHQTKRLQVASFRFDEMKVQPLGPDVAIVTGRMAEGERGHDRGEDEAAEERGGVYGQRALHSIAMRLDQRFGEARFGDHRLAPFGVGGAGLRQFHRPRRPPDQRNSQSRLERRHPSADRRGGQAEILRGRFEMRTAPCRCSTRRRSTPRPRSISLSPGVETFLRSHVVTSPGSHR